ncbi:FMN-dependent NADH-azoreductase [Algivirga pacifica]
MTILKINSSVQSAEVSVSRQLVEELVATLSTEGTKVIDRDLTRGVSLLSGETVGAFYTAPEERTEAQKELIKESEALVAELQEADTLVLGVPIYNFSVPASMKAYFDQVARAGVTFKYTEQGPVGLLSGKKAYVVIASGGVPFDSEVDFATKLVRQFLTFIGISDIEFIPADQLMGGADAVIAKAKEIIGGVTSEA